MIRKADINDLPRLTELFSELHEFHCRIFGDANIMPGQDFFRDKMSELLTSDENTVLISENAEIDGYAALRFINTDGPDRPKARICFIDCFAVTEKRRRNGIGTALFEGVRDLARKNGCDRVQLGVTAKNDGARRFYEKMGLAPRTIIMYENL